MRKTAYRIGNSNIICIALVRQVITSNEKVQQAWSMFLDLLVKVDRIICNFVKSYVMINELG